MKVLVGLLVVGVFAVAGMLFIQYQHTIKQELAAEEQRKVEEYRQELDLQMEEIDRQVRSERELERFNRVL